MGTSVKRVKKLFSSSGVKNFLGVLVPFEGKLLFIEKLAFQEPYQAIKFANRTQLSDYLMNRYDVEWEQPNAIPFIMENDVLMDGYRPNPYKKEQRL